MSKIKISVLMSTILLLSFLSFSVFSAEVDSNFKLKPVPEMQNSESDWFPGDPAEHKALLMWTGHTLAYQQNLLHAIQALIRKYGDNIDIAVIAMGTGLHILAKEPQRDVDFDVYDRIASLSENNNVRWIACGSTMISMGWKDSDMRPFTEYSSMGIAALMELQEEGYKLLTW